MAQHNFTRRQFLKATAAGGATCTIGVLVGHPAPKIKWPMTQVASIGGVPTFVYNHYTVNPRIGHTRCRLVWEPNAAFR